MKVSVLLISYNQERYIASALESILTQKTNFEWELIIGDDASPDKTGEIICELVRKAPKNCKVRPFLRENNLGASQNLFDLIRKAEGEYLTVLEGDDYWLEETRLQTLVDFLDTHTEYVGVSYKRERRLNGELVKYDPDESVVGKEFTLQDYFDGKRFSAMACLFRNIYTEDYEGFEHLYTGARNACDQIMCYSILFSGNIFILDKVFGVYRIASGGYCSQQSQLKRVNDYLAQNKRLIEYYGKHNAIETEIRILHAEAMKILLGGKKIFSVIGYYNKITKEEKKGVFPAFIKMLSNKLKRRK